MNRYIRLVTLIFSMFIICGIPASADDSYTYSIMHISDIQYLSELYPSTLNITFSFLESIKSTVNLSAIIITGDFVNDGDNVSQWTNYVNARSITTIPVYEIPGDNDAPLYDEFVGNKAELNAVINDFYFIGIESNEESLSESEISYYTSIINAQTQKFLLIAVHDYFNQDLTLSPVGMSIKENLILKPTFVMSGHIHDSMIRSTRVNNFSYIEDLTDYQDSGDFSAGKLYTVYVDNGDVEKVTVRDAYIYPYSFFLPEHLLYPSDEVVNHKHRGNYAPEGRIKRNLPPSTRTNYDYR